MPMLADFALAASRADAHWRLWRPFLKATERPRAVQDALLKRILLRERDTAFGRRHGFGKIAALQDYRRALPVQDYEGLRPLIDEQRATGRPCLTRARPVIYARTSGTTARPKDIPITRAGLARYARDQRLMAYALGRGAPLTRGKVLGIGSPAVEGWFPDGTPYGSASGMIYKAMPRFMRSKYVLPPEVFEIDDYETRYVTMAALALSEPRVTGLLTANPSTLSKLLSVMRAHGDQLVDMIARGQLDLPDSVEPRQARAIQRVFRPERTRARHLSAILRREAWSFADPWPGLEAIATWKGGSCGFALEPLAANLPERVKLLELGYLASEMRGTILAVPERDLCLPMLQENVFEFVAREDWEQGRQRFLALDELESGRQYYLFVTTQDGLYRYDMNDIVECRGHHNETPYLAFVQKGKGVTNISGEKLTESQVLEAVRQARRTCRTEIGFFVLLADEVRSGYRLFLECNSAGLDLQALERQVERHLRCLNVEYDAKRASDRLSPLTCSPLRPGTADAYREACVAAGQRDAQFKVKPLQYARDCPFDFDTYCLWERAA